jgi:hypothetical protein
VYLGIKSMRFILFWRKKRKEGKGDGVSERGEERGEGGK